MYTNLLLHAGLTVHNTSTGEAIGAVVTYSCSIPDLAIVKLARPFESHDTAKFASLFAAHTESSVNMELDQGHEVVVVGFSLQPTAATINKTGPLMSRGVLSKAVCDHAGQPVMFVTTAAVNPGMSGGLVACGRTGRLLGMVVSNSQ